MESLTHSKNCIQHICAEKSLLKVKIPKVWMLSARYHLFHSPHLLLSLSSLLKQRKPTTTEIYSSAGPAL